MATCAPVDSPLDGLSEGIDDDIELAGVVVVAPTLLAEEVVAVALVAEEVVEIAFVSEEVEEVTVL